MSQKNGFDKAASGAPGMTDDAHADSAGSDHAEASRPGSNPGESAGPSAERPAPANGNGAATNGANGRAPAPRAARPAGAREVTAANGRGPNGAAPLERRSGDQEFRQVLTKGLAACRRDLVTVGIFSFAVNLLVLAIPIYLFQISDRVLTSRSSDTLIMLSVIVVGAILFHVVLDMMRRFILMRVAVEFESKLGAPVLSAAAKASQNGSSREFQVLGDLQHIRSFVTGPVLLNMFDAPIAPIYLAAVFLIHPHLGFIVAGTGAFLLLIAFINQKMTAVPFGRASAFGTRANLQADAMARNSQVMNAMGMIPEGVLIWGRETAESLTAQVNAQDRNIILTGISKFIRLSTQIGILGWGAWLALQQELTGGMIIAASIVGSRALAPIEATIEGWRSFVHARTAYSRIKALLQNSPLNLERLRLPRPEGRLTVERVLYVPPPNKKVILNGVTFNLEPGESLAIVGESGTGKSTLGKMLVGSIFPTAGNIRLDMMDLRNWDPRQFGENVGYLPQDVQLFPASIKANIARMREDANDEDVFYAAEMADVHEMISEFAQGYETQIAMDGSPLSGGQKQRIGLARAFFGSPRLVVLDEPNSNLDSPGEYALAQSMLRAKERGITIVAITQRPALLKSVDKIMILKQGAVHAIGKRDDMIPIIMNGGAAAGARLANGPQRAAEGARAVNA
jgi:ATP-binding cassette subfamily C protein